MLAHGKYLGRDKSGLEAGVGRGEARRWGGKRSESVSAGGRRKKKRMEEGREEEGRGGGGGEGAGGGGGGGGQEGQRFDAGGAFRTRGHVSDAQ